MNSNVLIVIGVLLLMLVLSGGLTNLNNEKLEHENAIVSEEDVRHSELPVDHEEEHEAEQEAEHEAEQEAEQEAEHEAEHQAEHDEPKPYSSNNLGDEPQPVDEDELRADAEQQKDNEVLKEEREVAREETVSCGNGLSNGKWSVSGWSDAGDYASF